MRAEVTVVVRGRVVVNVVVGVGVVVVDVDYVDDAVVAPPPPPPPCRPQVIATARRVASSAPRDRHYHRRFHRRIIMRQQPGHRPIGHVEVVSGIVSVVVVGEGRPGAPAHIPARDNMGGCGRE